MPAATTAPMDRLQIVTVPQPERLPGFAEDVAAGLSASPKRLNSKYFYDAAGSALFDAITQLPEYYLTRAETGILREWGWEIVRAPVSYTHLFRAGVFALAQNFLPRRSAVGAAVEPALLVWTVRVAEHGGKHAIRITWINGDGADLHAVAQPQMRPGRTRIARFVDAVADG